MIIAPSQLCNSMPQDLSHFPNRPVKATHTKNNCHAVFEAEIGRHKFSGFVVWQWTQKGLKICLSGVQFLFDNTPNSSRDMASCESKKTMRRTALILTYKRPGSKTI